MKRSIFTRRAVTLTETLVTIIIVAVLASIIFPALMSTKDRARATDDLSKMHQLGIAYALYTEQNGDFDGQPVRLVNAGLLPSQELSSSRDTTTPGLAQNFAKSSNGYAPHTSYKRSFTGYADIGVLNWAYKEQCGDKPALGWLIDPTDFTLLPSGLLTIEGNYRRLLNDGSVQRRTIQPTITFHNGMESHSISNADLLCDRK